MKRLFDFMASLLGLIVLFPFLVPVAIAIKLSDFGPVFFPQKRIGQKGNPFRMWKFRSMRPLADKQGPALTIGADNRITPIGKILRKTKIDELPQLWNVICGDMSLVGPRPEVEKYTSLYSPAQQKVLEIKPGITDPASFAFYDEAAILAQKPDPEAYYTSVLMAEKIRINLDYAARRSLLSDLTVIVFTLLKPFGIKANLFAILRIEPPIA